jgi:hypothetical protein
MHIFVILVNLRSVRLARESRKSLLEDIAAEGLIAGNQDVNSEIELVPIDEERVCDVARDDRGIVHVYIIDIVDDVDALALAGVCWLDDPHVLLAVMLLKFLVVGVEITKLIRQDVGIRDEVEVGFPKFLLHADHVVAETILARDLVALGEVVDLLVLV